ncbi:TetR/AcrR family transcriptional regulator [Caldibacillus lycopersici]|uniref:TetR/AcrR family transcriptional regulator n=1 Tax=Perspicuibacillus lycopersici TaxID=1325689 RepID=A0AAE3LLW2_9BACI|nr:TetR/AcrR family transcriptional regulator [Perspicuibacillus lycopersici]MCU9612341.1 TetR/AcrR family transcriptional regulator [Perspicuibacillus lycopersici]
MNRRKRHVAEVAFNLFVEKGIQQTSIQEIIERANISKGTFYNYFSTKNDCIAEILEGLRYDASQLRMEMQVGRDAKDRQILIEQISILIKLNEERNLHALFEAIIGSNELELKKLVMHHRMYETEWVSERFIEVFGEHIRHYAFELAVLFMGMLQQMLFIMKISNNAQSEHRIVEVLISYIELMIPKILEKNSALLDSSNLHFLRTKIERKVIKLEELFKMANQLKEVATFTIEQHDLFSAILEELSHERIRKSVLQPLIKPFLQTFEQTSLESQAKIFTNSVWYFIKRL